MIPKFDEKSKCFFKKICFFQNYIDIMVNGRYNVSKCMERGERNGGNLQRSADTIGGGVSSGCGLK